MPLKKPIKIGKYEVVGLLGKGGMGVVYKANDPLLGRSVAIKMMTTLDYVDNPDLLQRFYREAQSTGNLHHRNIVTVYELGDHEGSPYLVMEYLEGETLDAVIQSNRSLPLLDQINFILEVCDGLTYAHQRGVVHRDIKPGNIMVLKDSGVKIVDFGIAHIGNRTVTRTGQLLGSLPYMSPEQISGKQVDARTDIFSLGVVFHQLLTSHLPFEGETPAATLLKIMHERPRPVADYDPSFPSEIDEIILRALAKDREERYPSAQDLAFDLVQIRSRLQDEVVEERLNEAERLLSQEELVKARDKLSEVLKIDRHNTRAVELSRATQQRIQQQEVGAQVRQLRTQAEEAYQKEQFVLALDLIQKAMSLHTTDPDLHRLRSSVQDAKTKSERLQQSVSRAEAAFEHGDLDSAMHAIEEALSVAPDDVHAKSLHRMIQRDWDQRAQRRQALDLIEEARKEFTSRNFTLAMEVLRKAEAIDPDTPQLRSLIETVQAAREQEKRRKALEAIKKDIEANLDRDEFHEAHSRAESALQDFPEDRGLQKLKDLAHKQRVFAERKQFIEEQVSQARKLLEAGRAGEVLEVLQSARDKVGSDTQLDSLMSVVRETLERQKLEARKLEFVRRAKDELRLQQYAAAIQTLQTAQSELGSNPEIDDLLQFTIEQQIADRRRKIADEASENAQAFVKEGDYEKAVEVLEAALAEAPDEELRLILAQAHQAAADNRKLLEEVLTNTEGMIQAQRPAEALRYLESQPRSFSRDRRFLALRNKAQQQAERLQQIEQVLEKARVQSSRGEFDAARSALNEFVRLHGRTPEVTKLLAEIEQKEAQAVAESLEQALTESRALMSEGRPDQAIERLSLVNTIAGKVPRKLSDSFQALQQEAANAQARKYRSEIDRLMGEGVHSEAASILRRSLAEFPQNRELQQASKALEQSVQRRADAETLLDSARGFFAKGNWREGADVCSRIGPLVTRDPIIRNKVLGSVESAASTAANQDWRHAEYLLQTLSQLNPSAVVPDAIQEKIVNAKREESIREFLDEAKRRQAQAGIENALGVVSSGLEQFPTERRLLELHDALRRALSEKEDLARRERERSEKEKYVAEVEDRVRRESSAEGRVRILEEALRTYPALASLQESLAKAREVARKVSSLAAEAQSHEASRNYDRAIRSWAAIADLGIAHPDVENSIARLRKLQDQARATKKADRIRSIRESLGTFDLNGANSLLADALREFSGDTQLTELAVTRDALIKQRQEGLSLLGKAQGEFKAQRWQRGAELIGRSLDAANGDPAISGPALDTALQGCQQAMAVNPQDAQMLLEQAATIRPDSREVAKLRDAWEKQSREQLIKRRLDEVRTVAQSGDRQRALSEINSVYSSFPDEPRFVALRQEIERSIETERKAQEERSRRTGILEAIQNLQAQGNLSAAFQKVNEGLQAFPRDVQFLEIKRSLEKSIRDLEKQRHREEKQRALQVEQDRKAQRQQKQRREVEEKKRRIVESVPTAISAAKPADSPKQPLLLYVAAGVVLAAALGGLVWKVSRRNPAPTSPTAVAVPVRVETTPAGATVRSVETGESCVTPNCSLKLTPGDHDLQIDHAGYQSLTKSISVDANASNPIAITLVPLPRTSEEASAVPSKPETARLEVKNAPPGVEVVLDQKQVGRTNRQGNFARDVAPGSHQIQLLARNREQTPVQREFSGGSTVQLTGDDFAPSKPPVVTAGPSAEQSEWQRLKDSQDIQAVDSFVKRHPGGQFTSQAHAKLEDLYWGKATSAGTASGYSQYLEQFPNGKYVQQARNNVADLEWRGLENSTDANGLQSFLRKYPSGSYHDKAEAKLDDLSWQHTDQNNLSSLKSYIGNYPEGRHAAEARKKADDLSHVAATPRANESRSSGDLRATQPPAVDDNKAVLEVLSRYQKAYEARDVQALQTIWPGMTEIQIKSVGDFFRQASDLSLQYQVSQSEVNGDSATVKFTQTLKYAAGGKSGKNSAKIVMQLNRAQGGTWRINSIR